MLDLLFIALEAHNEERNHHRRYELSVGQDLLGDWTVGVSYGRVGRPLRTVHFGSPDHDRMKALVRERLRRRLGAHRRLGCRYDVKTVRSVPALECWIAGTIAERPSLDG